MEVRNRYDRKYTRHMTKWIYLNRCKLYISSAVVIQAGDTKTNSEMVNAETEAAFFGNQGTVDKRMINSTKK